MESSTDLKQKVRIGVLGAGKHSQEYLLPAIQACPDLEFYALCTHHKNADVLAQYRIPYWTNDWHELIDNPDVDALVVCADPILHAELVLTAHQARKPILIEKPLALSVDHWRKIRHQLTRINSNSPIMVDYNYRRSAAYERFYNEINQSKLTSLTYQFLTSKPKAPFWPGHTVIESMIYGVDIHVLSMLAELKLPEIKDFQVSVDSVNQSGYTLTIDLTLANDLVVKLLLSNEASRLEMAYTAKLLDHTEIKMINFDKLYKNDIEVPLLRPLSSEDRNGYQKVIQQFVQAILNPKSWNKSQFISEEDYIYSLANKILQSTQ